MSNGFRLFFLALLGCLLSACVSPYTTFKEFMPKLHPNQLRVVTYNVNWGEGPWKIESPMPTINLIQIVNPDVILLQETTPWWERAMHKYLSKHYPYRYFHHFFQGGGLAVLSKYPIYNRIILPPKPGWYPASLMDIKTPLGLIQFLNLHLVPTNSPHDTTGLQKIGLFEASGVRRKEIEYFYNKLNRRKPTIIVGDFNEGDYGKAATFLRKHGFQDALIYTKPYIHTWRWRVGFITFADRYDRVFFTPHLKLQNIQVLHEGTSDHFPTVVDFSRRYQSPNKRRKIDRKPQPRYSLQRQTKTQNKR